MAHTLLITNYKAFPEMPFCNLQKNHIFILVPMLPKDIIFIDSCGCGGVFGFPSSRSELSSAVQRKQETKEPSLSLSSFCFSPLLLFLVAHLVIFSLPSSLSVSSFILSSSWLGFLCDLMNKMKGVAAMAPPPYALYEDPRNTFKHQNLLQDYLQLHKKTEGVKETLKRVKQKKLTLLDEVRYLRRRYKYLIKKRSPNPNPNPKWVPMQPHKQEVRSRNNMMKRNHSAKEAPLQHRALGIDLNQKGMVDNGKQASSASGINLNQGRSCGGKDAALLNVPFVDLNVKETACNEEEAVMRNRTPVFDLNQISREEEEALNGGALRYEEPEKSSMRIVKDEQQNDMRLWVCRDIGNGKSPPGKMKNTWEDQVALRV